MVRALTTYQITAEALMQKEGPEKALEMARLFARHDQKKRIGDRFWDYVAAHIVRIREDGA